MRQLLAGLVVLTLVQAAHSGTPAQQGLQGKWKFYLMEGTPMGAPTGKYKTCLDFPASSTLEFTGADGVKDFKCQNGTCAIDARANPKKMDVATKNQNRIAIWKCLYEVTADELTIAIACKREFLNVLPAPVYPPSFATTDDPGGRLSGYYTLLYRFKRAKDK